MIKMINLKYSSDAIILDEKTLEINSSFRKVLDNLEIKEDSIIQINSMLLDLMDVENKLNKNYKNYVIIKDMIKPSNNFSSYEIHADYLNNVKNELKKFLRNLNKIKNEYNIVLILLNNMYENESMFEFLDYAADEVILIDVILSEIRELKLNILKSNSMPYLTNKEIIIKK